jgi:hypothetical protein
VAGEEDSHGTLPRCQLLANHSPDFLPYAEVGREEGLGCGGAVARGEMRESMPLFEGLVASQEALNMPTGDEFAGRIFDRADTNRFVYLRHF